MFQIVRHTVFDIIIMILIFGNIIQMALTTDDMS